MYGCRRYAHSRARCRNDLICCLARRGGMKCQAGFSATIRRTRRWRKNSRPRSSARTRPRRYSSRRRTCAPAAPGPRSLPQEIAEATAFILFVGEAGIGKWQVPEYDEALDKWVNSGRTFPLIVVLLKGRLRPVCSFCANCTGSSRLIQLRKIPSHAYLMEPPATAPIPANYGATPLPIAALRPWRRRTATTSSAASAKRSMCCLRLPGRPTDCRC